MILNLDSPKEVIIKAATPEEKQLISQVEVLTISDDMVSVKAVVVLNDLPMAITLWDGEAYQNIGDWTQAQANARILELI